MPNTNDYLNKNQDTGNFKDDLSGYRLDRYDSGSDSEADSRKDLELEKEKKAAALNKRVGEFKDLGGMSVKKMSLGLWFLERKPGIIKFFTIIFLSVAFGFLAYSMWGFGEYYIFGSEKDQYIVDQIVDGSQANLAIIQQSRPEELLVSQVYSIFVNKKYDLMVEAENPNSRHYALIDYCFQTGEIELKCDSDFILPGTVKYISALSLDDKSARKASFNVKNITWTRINPRKYGVWEDFHAEHFNFDIDDIDYEVLSGESGTGTKFNVLSFKARNKSAYNYREVPFNIVLFSGSQPVGIYRLARTNFMSGETQVIKITWSGNYGSIGHIEVIPDIDITKKDVYLDFEGAGGANYYNE